MRQLVVAAGRQTSAGEDNPEPRGESKAGSHEPTRHRIKQADCGHPRHTRSAGPRARHRSLGTDPRSPAAWRAEVQLRSAGVRGGSAIAGASSVVGDRGVLRRCQFAREELCLRRGGRREAVAVERGERGRRDRPRRGVRAPDSARRRRDAPARKRTLFMSSRAVARLRHSPVSGVPRHAARLDPLGALNLVLARQNPSTSFWTTAPEPTSPKTGNRTGGRPSTSRATAASSAGRERTGEGVTRIPSIAGTSSAMARMSESSTATASASPPPSKEPYRPTRCASTSSRERTWATAARRSSSQANASIRWRGVPGLVPTKRGSKSRTATPSWTSRRARRSYWVRRVPLNPCARMTTPWPLGRRSLGSVDHTSAGAASRRKLDGLSLHGRGGEPHRVGPRRQAATEFQTSSLGSASSGWFPSC